MNNKWSFHILFAILLIASSCKSEKKPVPPVQEDATVNNQITDAVSQEDTTIEAAIPEESEVQKPSDEESKPTKEKAAESKTEPKKEEKKSKPKVDRGIQIEMGMDDVDPETEEQEEPKNEETTIEKENEPEETKEIKDERPSKPEIIEKVVGFPRHSALDKLLKAHVSSQGAVDYAALKNKEAELDEYLKMLEGYSPSTTWNRNQKLAYWINAYNAYTLKLILKNYPVGSITDLHGGKPWDVKWINLDGKNLSLNNIENDIIRPEFNEPRIHFAVNCAAKSCPPLLNGAYVPSTLDAQLESQTKKFINNQAFNTLGKNEIEVSKIFEWYQGDFGDIVSFVMRYANKTVKPKAKVKFKEYDWALNGK